MNGMLQYKFNIIINYAGPTVWNSLPDELFTYLLTYSYLLIIQHCSSLLVKRMALTDMIADDDDDDSNNNNNHNKSPPPPPSSSSFIGSKSI